MKKHKNKRKLDEKAILSYNPTALISKPIESIPIREVSLGGGRFTEVYPNGESIEGDPFEFDPDDELRDY